MGHLLEHIISSGFNALSSRGRTELPGGPRLRLGRIVRDGRTTDHWLTIPADIAIRHIFVYGSSGYGKTSLLKGLSAQCVRTLHWSLFQLMLHGDIQPFVLSTLAELEREQSSDLGEHTVIFSLTDRQHATGLNFLEARGEHELFVLAAEISEMIRVRFGLDSLGVRILELLRNSVFVLAANGYTLLEFRLLLTNAGFRGRCLANIRNSEVLGYFREHFEKLSSAEQATYAAAVLNKISELAADPLIAEVIGQQESAVSLSRAMDSRMVVLFDADKAVLREQAATLASLFFIKLKNAIFTRQKRTPVMIAIDEAHNIVHRMDTGLETVLGEARKYGACIVAITQQLQMLSPVVRSALLGVGTQCFFRASVAEAGDLSGYLGGGKHLTERLKNLPQRHMIVKTGDEPIREVVVPEIKEPAPDYSSLYRRSMQRWGRARTEVAEEIKKRHGAFTEQSSNKLDDWE